MRACPAAGTAADTAADLAAGHALTLPISPLTPLSILAQHPPHPHHTHTTQLITSASTPPNTRQSTHTLNPIRDSLPSLGEISLQFGPATGPLPYRGSIGPGSSAGLLHAISLATGAPTAALTTDSAAISPAFTRGPITHPPLRWKHHEGYDLGRRSARARWTRGRQWPGGEVRQAKPRSTAGERVRGQRCSSQRCITTSSPRSSPSPIHNSSHPCRAIPATM